ncbi:MAG TPA: hypothetical protein VFI65_19440 [Streptosporangiaceae bacterium]|nr:hypothetical protein [Streptosporangiaceae bacterium]
MSTTRLRPCVHVAPVDSGVAFLGLDDSFVLSGNTEGIWTLWRAVAPMLEQGVDLADLLGAAKTPSVRRLLETLIEQFTAHNMLISPAAGPDDQNHPEAEKFAEVFGFLEAVAPDPARSFAALRAASVTVEGPADLVFAAARTLARSAIGRIGAKVTDGEPLDVGRLAQYVGLDGIDLAVGAGPFPDVPDVLITTPGSPSLDADGGPRRFEVLVMPDFAAIAAVAGPEHPTGLEPTWPNQLRSDDPGPASPVLITLAASTAAHQAVLAIAGLPARADGRQVIGIDAVDLATTTHLVPLPTGQSAGGESGYLLEAQTEINADPSTPEELLALASALTDDRFGLLSPPHPQALIQIPLALALCGNAGGFRGVVPPGQHGMLGVAETGEYARLDALLAAVRGLPGPLPDGSAKARCVSTGQLLAMDPALDWVVAAGHDLRQLAGDALTRLLVAQAAQASRFESIELSPGVDPQSWRWLKTMTIRWAHQVRLVRWNPPDLPGWVVIGAQAGDAKLAGWTAGPDEADCIRAALIRLCGAAQAMRDPAAPPLPDPIAATSVTWPDLRSAIATLAAAGLRLVLVPWTAQPAVADAGILLAYAGISHDRP